MNDPSTADDSCRVCGNADGNVAFIAKEMMFGTRERFDYVECGACHSLQIDRIPNDLGRFYPRDYFSYGAPRVRPGTAVRRWVDSRRVRWHLEGTGLIGRAFDAVSKPLDYLSWIRTLGLDTSARILDVGCGSGKLALRLSLGGFRHVLGIDPELPADLEYPGGVRILGQTLAAFAAAAEEPQDLVMFHHSLEHMPDPGQQLAIARRLLGDRGHLLVRVPVAGSAAWERYRENWVQLDPPRHLYLFTRRGLSTLAAANGLEVVSFDCDSTPFQFTGSELYQRDIPLNAPEAEKAIFSAEELSRFKAETARLNAEGNGDQAIFVLRAA